MLAAWAGSTNLKTQTVNDYSRNQLGEAKSSSNRLSLPEGSGPSPKAALPNGRTPPRNPRWRGSLCDAAFCNLCICRVRAEGAGGNFPPRRRSSFVRFERPMSRCVHRDVSPAGPTWLSTSARRSEERFSERQFSKVPALGRCVKRARRETDLCPAARRSRSGGSTRGHQRRQPAPLRTETGDFP